MSGPGHMPESFARQKLAKQEHRDCNMHRDCDAADAEAIQRGALKAVHCYSSDCEECFPK